ncbi:sugar kinase [Sporolactobacillus sp. THM7-7]|nr:sugar kinase [Sporolactobacillus sp. THM7-7]
MNGYLIFDIGTGNARVAVTDVSGRLKCVVREDITYKRDPDFADSLIFSPDELWKQLVQMAKRAIQRAPGLNITGITSTSQREGIVLIDRSGKPYLGLPNIDNRGLAWEKQDGEAQTVLKITGRHPTALFSALKLVATREKQPEYWKRLLSFTSISEWMTYMLSGELVFEPSQATETLLYDVKNGRWSEKCCDIYQMDQQLLPKVVRSGTVAGRIRKTIAAEMGLPNEAVVIVGGADTQMAIKSTQPGVNDFIIVSGTTTPIVKVMDRFIVDSVYGSWTNGHVEKNQWLFESNSSVTGLNYQRLKNIFYPDESYETIEHDMAGLSKPHCLASLGSMLAIEKHPLTYGGFMIQTPISHQLNRTHFMWAALWDIACTIKTNFDTLAEITGQQEARIWGCGGGFQSQVLGTFVSSLMEKDILLRDGYPHASIIGCVMTCNEALHTEAEADFRYRTIRPDDALDYRELYNQWKRTRQIFQHQPPLSVNQAVGK